MNLCSREASDLQSDAIDRSAISPYICFNEQLLELLHLNTRWICQWNYSKHNQSSNHYSCKSYQHPHLSSSSQIIIRPFISSEDFHQICREIYHRTSKSHNQQSKHDTSKHFSNTSWINVKIADNGTWTRTSRAEVCYATPTTSYPHSIFQLL